MSTNTKTVKLDATLHEELKSIADKGGFILQDLIEEKLTEILEEKGVFNFSPNIEFSPDTQQFKLTLSTESYNSLIILFKRLCLNEKINNLNQMNSLLDTIKNMENVYEFNSNNIQENKINDFFKGGQLAINNIIKENKVISIPEEHKFSQIQTYDNNKGCFTKQGLSCVYEPELTESEKNSKLLTDMINNIPVGIEENIMESHYDGIALSLKKDLLLNEYKDSIIRIKVDSTWVSKHEGFNKILNRVSDMEDCTKLSDNLYYLFKTSKGLMYSGGISMYFIADYLDILSYFDVNINIDMVEEVSMEHLQNLFK